MNNIKYNIEIIEANDSKEVKAFANIQFENIIKINNIKIIENNNELIIEIPKISQNNDGCFLINGFEKELEEKIVEAYKTFRNRHINIDTKIIKLSERKDNLKAIATIIINNTLVFTGIKILEGNDVVSVVIPPYLSFESQFGENIINSIKDKYYEEFQDNFETPFY